MSQRQAESWGNGGLGGMRDVDVDDATPYPPFGGGGRKLSHTNGGVESFGACSTRAVGVDHIVEVDGFSHIT